MSIGARASGGDRMDAPALGYEPTSRGKAASRPPLALLAERGELEVAEAVTCVGESTSFGLVTR